jgi:hypothetical protein
MVIQKTTTIRFCYSAFRAIFHPSKPSQRRDYHAHPKHIASRLDSGLGKPSIDPQITIECYSASPAAL